MPIKTWVGFFVYSKTSKLGKHFIDEIITADLQDSPVCMRKNYSFYLRCYNFFFPKVEFPLLIKAKP